MSTPAPIRLIEKILERFPYPVATVGAVVFFPLLILFVSAGALRPLSGFDLWEDPLEIFGLFLLLALLPACLLMWFMAWVRLRESLILDIHAQMEEGSTAGTKQYRYAGFWPAALLLGVFFAIFGNLSLSSISLDPGSPIFVISIALVFGQVFMWAMISLVLFFVLLDDLELFRCGRTVRVNIYNLDRLNGFGRAALRQFFMVIGALALTTLQSLDIEFRWINYANGLYVGVPAAIVFILLPTWSIRKRIASAKTQTLATINAEIQRTSTALDNDALVRLNALIARRDQVQHTRTWPMDISIFSRFLFYIFIPPLAWIGAALMEVVIDSFLGS